MKKESEGQKTFVFFFRTHSVLEPEVQGLRFAPVGARPRSPGPRAPCYPHYVESLGEESPRLFFLVRRGEKCLDLLGLGITAEQARRRFGKERLVRFRMAFSSLLWRLRRFSGRYVENVAFSGCSVTVLADLGYMGCFVDDYLLV